MMKKIVYIFSLLVLCSFSANAVSSTSKSAQLVPVDKVAAIVNDSVITESEVDAAIVTAKQMLQASHAQIPNAKSLRQQVIDSLIDRSLQQQVIKRANIKVSDADLNKAMQEIASRNHLSVSQLRVAVERQGHSFAKYKQQLRQQIAMMRLQQQAVGQLTVTDAEAKAFINQHKNMPSAKTEYHVQDILIPLADNPTAAQKSAANVAVKKIITRLKHQENFKQIAKEHMSGVGHLQSSDLGWRTLEQMPSIFAAQVRGVQAGEAVGPIAAPNGLHVLKIAAIRGAKQTLTLQQAKELLYQQKFAQKLQAWLKTMRSQAYIKIISA